MFLFIFSFKKSKNTLHSPPSQPCKTWFKDNSQNYLRPCDKVISNIKLCNFGIIVLQQFATTWKLSHKKCFSKSLPPTVCSTPNPHNCVPRTASHTKILRLSTPSSSPPAHLLYSLFRALYSICSIMYDCTWSTC